MRRSNLRYIEWKKVLCLHHDKQEKLGIIYRRDKCKMIDGFTKTYNIEKLVYYEMFAEPIQAIAWKKKIKAGSRQKKLNLILQKNPDWIDLYDEI